MLADANSTTAILAVLFRALDDRRALQLFGGSTGHLRIFRKMTFLAAIDEGLFHMDRSTTSLPPAL
jgi:hypothetical protein